MALPDARRLTFLRGSGFLVSLIGEWDLMADESGQWPDQKGFLIFDETKIISVIERNAGTRRGIEGSYSVEGNRIVITELLIDTAREQGALGDFEFELDGDHLTIIWLSAVHPRQVPDHVDRFQRRSHANERTVLPREVAIYESGGQGHKM